MVDETVPCNGLNFRNDLLRIRVDTQKNQTEGGEKFLHGVESTPVWSGVQTLSETSSCYLVGLSVRKISSEVGISTTSVSRVLSTC